MRAYGWVADGIHHGVYRTYLSPLWGRGSSLAQADSSSIIASGFSCVVQAGTLAFIHGCVHLFLCCASMPTFIHLCTDARNISGTLTVPGTVGGPEDRVVERTEQASAPLALRF